MKILMRILAIAFLFSGSLFAQAASAACEWNADCLTWNYDQIGGAPSGIVSHRVETAKAVAGPWTEVANVLMPAMSYKRLPVDGTNFYRIVTIYTGNVLSSPSVTASSTAVPPAVTTLQVADNRAYRLDQGYANQLRISQIGVVPVGSLCIEQGVVGWNPVDKVTMSLNVVASRKLAVVDPGKSLPLAVLAECKRS